MRAGTEAQARHSSRSYYVARRAPHAAAVVVGCAQ